MVPSVTAQERCDIEALVYEHAWLIDTRASERLAELYTENGRLIGSNGIGLNCQNPEEIAAYGRRAAQRANVTARHVVTNIRLVKLDENRVQGNMMIGLCRSEHPLGDPTPIALADANDIYVRGDDGRWRIEERRLHLVLEAPAHRSPAPAVPAPQQAT